LPFFSSSRAEVPKQLPWQLCHFKGDLTAAFQYLKGAYKKDGETLFTRVCTDRTRGKGFKLTEDRSRLDTRKKFFTVRVVRHWHRLPRKVVDAPS